MIWPKRYKCEACDSPQRKKDMSKITVIDNHKNRFKFLVCQPCMKDYANQMFCRFNDKNGIEYIGEAIGYINGNDKVGECVIHPLEKK